MCDIESVCEYLQAPSGNLFILGNAPGCENLIVVTEACESIGNDEKSYKNICQVFPNPVHGDFLYFQINEINQYFNFELIVINSNGLAIYSEKFNKKGTCRIEVSNWSPGIYMIIVRSDGDQVWNTKLIVH